MTTTSDKPSRLVDRHNQGWYLTIGGYEAGPRSGLDGMYLEELTAERGPWRPVLPITDADEALLVDTFTRAGRRTITTLAVALADVFRALREQHGQDHPANYQYARRTITAGREGSWEAAVLLEVIMFGYALADGSPRRIDADARRTFVEVLTRWISDPERYTEVAATLAEVVSAYADKTAGADGWRAVADQWLQPGALARDDFTTCYRLFYSVSAHFDADLL